MAASSTEIGQEQAEALGVLIRGVASYRGLSPDEYVRQRFSGVVKGGEPAENALFQRMELDDKNIPMEPAGKEFKEPQKTIKAYKMFRTLKSRPGEIFPLFIGKTKPTPIGKWIPAEFLPTKGYAQRPGWHAGVLPYAPHLMKKDGTMQAGRVWAEVELPADVDWQSVADKSKTRDIRDAIPEGGYYRFKTNKMQGGAWLIGGAIKVNKILSPDEVRSILKEHGIDVQFKVIDGVPVAAVEFNEDAKALIRALKAPTVADMAHELGHVFRRDLSAKDLAIIEDWAGVLDGAWTVEAEEKFADGFVEYLAEGRAPNENLRGVFEKFKRWITKIFENISKRTKVELSDPVREVFDRLVGGKELEKKPKPEEPKTKPEKLSNLEQQLTEKGVEYTKDVDGSLIIGKGIVWAKDKWNRDVPARGSVGVHASTLIMAPKIAFKKVSDRFYVSEDKKYGVRKEEDGTWSALQFKDKDRSGEYETDLLWDGASTAKEAATYIEEYVVDKEGKPPTYFFELESSFSDKDVVKKLGAKWGPQVNRKEKSWFLPTNKLMGLLDAFDNVYISRAAVEMFEKSLKEEPKAKEAKTEEVSEESQLDASVRIAKFVTNSLKSKEKFDSRQLFNVANEAYGGTQAEGKYTPKDAYDAMELGVNTYILERGFNSDIDSLGLAADTLEMIEEDILAMIPTQTKRTEEQEAFQQFSTPPNIAFVAAWAANIKPGETVLEPSAGVGGLAVFAKNAGAKVVVNELSERRAKLLKELDFDKVFTENAEQIDNILPDDIKPTVVLMNPPFSATAGRMGQKKATQFAKRHVEQALSRLEPNGRLVAILGRGMADSTATFRDWWAEIKKEYNVLANITIEGANYRKYGTTFDIQLVIIDKTGPTTKKTLTGTVTDLDDILPILEGIRNDRTSVDRQVELAPSKSDSEETSSETEGEARPGHAIHLPTDGVGTGQPSAATSGAVEGLRDGIIRPEGITGHPDMSNRPTASTGRPDKGRPDRGSEVDQSEGAGEIEAGSGSGVRTAGAKPHPGDLVQSAAMAAVEPPAPTYVPNLPKNIIEEGKLSDAQLEAIVYAGQNFEKFLPNGMRKGFFIGDGTGVGKGREISGIILDSMRQGQTKAVWVSKVTDLIKDAKRDFGNIGGDSKLIFEHQKTKAGDSIRAKDGILFTTYTTLGWDLNVTASGDLTVKKGKHSRIDQVVEWLGKDFEGVIVFDEAHEMCNCMMQKKKIGKTKPAAKALAGIELARRLPKARVVYLSATGGVEVSDLGYAERLGLWGKDTAFANKEDFVDKISAGGIAAMELVARDMKAMGDYISRNLSYEGVTFETLEHQLDDNQIEMYDTMARAWQVVLQNIEKAIEETGAKRNGTAKRNAYSQFWGAQQRFFNQVLTSMQMPSVIKAIKNDLKNGRSVILQIVNTNFAAQERALAKSRSRGDDIEDLDLTPRGTLIEFLKKSFPVQQYEEFMDEDGNVLSKPVFDSQGNPVLNKHAVAMRDDLIERLGSMRIPDGPLEMLLNVFGKDNVAEVTGRTRRVVQVIDEETGKKKPIIESRSVNHRRADVQAFMDGKKRILVFSDAGGTGASYHADRAAKNQQPRTHYLLQAGWSAAKAMQGFGRSHRSNQAHPPHYVLVTTNLKGHRRFISTIARRLDQLGALTKGQRQAGSQGLFRASDNLESDIAKDALDVFYRNLVANRIEGLDGYDVLKRLGLDKALLDQRGSLKDAPDRRETAKFLNRILVLESELQNKVFDVYFGTVEAMTQKAIENGTLDIGMEDYRRDKIEVINEKTVYTEPESGAETKYIELNAGDKTRPISFKAAKGIKNLMGFYQNKRSKRVYAIADSGYKTTLENGHVVRMLKRYGQEYSSTELINEEEFTKQLKSGAYIELTPEQAEPLWNEAYEKIPEYKMEKVHLISGVLLPIWDRLPQTRMRVVRIRTDEGHVFLGRIVPAKSINTVLHNLGADLVEIKRTHQDIFKAILEDGESFKLVNGWELKRRRVANEYRIELIGDDLWKFKEELFEAGVFTEEIDYKVRYFIPVSDKGADVIKQITARRPIVTDVPATSTESLDDVLDRFKDKVNEAMPEEPPKGGFSIYAVSRYERRKAKEPAKVERKQFTFDDPEIEKRWQAAKLPKETFLNNIKEFFTRSWHQLSRKYEHLPDNAEFAELHTALDRLESARSVVRYKVYSMQQGITIKLDDYTMDLFTRYVVLADMKEDVAIRKAENEPIGKPIIDEETGDIIGYELPFGFTEESLERNFERLNQEIEKYPEIKEAIKDRKDVWEAIVNDYVKAMADIGFHVENRFRRKNYFHRMVIEYMAAKRLGIRGTGGAIEKGPLKGRGFLKARKGSSLDFNTDYVTAEYEVMAQMLYDIEVAKAIKLVEEEYNQRRSLEREAKRRNQAAIDKIIQEEIKQYGIGNSPLENELKALDQKMAMSFSQLQEMAEYNKLWTGDDGEWSTAVDELAQGERDTTYERSRMMNYLAALADKENEGLPGNLQARTIFKAIQERKDLIEETLGDKFVTFKDIIPEGYVLHRIEKGHIFYFAHTIPEHLVDQITDKMLEEIQIPREYIRQVKAVAGAYPAMVVKEEVSLTLENFKKDPLDNVISQAAVYLTRPWKIYVLTAPHRWYKYNLRNLSGDAEAVFVGNPSAFKKVPQAVTELYEVMFKDRPMSSDMREAFERGLFQILQQSVEVGDLDKLSMFEHLYEKEQRYEKYGKAGKLITMPTKAWQTYWKYARLSTDFREAILRYACFLDYLEQIRNNPEGKPKNFGASMPENVMALKNPYDRAFKLSNELCGAYNRVGVIGQHLRKSYIPFWSWNEVNFRRNIQLWKNIWNEAKFSQEVGRKLAGMVGRKIATKTIKIPLKIAKVPIEVVLTPFNIMKSPLSLFNLGKVAIAMFKFWAILTVWNYLIFRDEEEDLPKDVRYKPHIIFGRDKDGNVMYLDRLGILEDFLEWFGLDDAGIYIYEHLNGRRTFRETIKDMVIAPFDKLAQGFMPLLKIPAEAAIGTSIYPSITEKRHIYDGWEYLAEQFGFKGAYKAMTGKPREPYYKSAEKWFTLVADPRRTAYFEIRDLSREYRKEVLKKNIGEGYFASSRSDVLYNIKQAIQLEDIEAFKKYLQEYIMLGGTAQDLEKSLKSQDPLYGLKGDALKDFYNNYLNPEEQAKVNLAVEYYYEVLLRKGDKRLGKAVDEALKELEKEIKK